MPMRKKNNFNTEPILNEIDLVIKKGLSKILKDYTDRYNLLESTHKKIMELPSVVNELNLKDNDYDDDDDESIKTNDVPIIVSIKDMTKELVVEEIDNVVSKFEKKIENLETKYDLIFPVFDKILEKINVLSNELKEIKISQNKVKLIIDNEKENIKLEIEEEPEAEPESEEETEPESEEEPQPESEEETEPESEEPEPELESEEEPEPELESEEEPESESELDEEEKNQQIEAEADDEAYEEADDEADKEADDEAVDEADEEADDEADEDNKFPPPEVFAYDEECAKSTIINDDLSIETENNSEDEEKSFSNEVEEKIPENKNLEENEDEELFEIEIDDITYCTNNEENGFIYELTEDGEVGEKVGYLKDSEPFFYADEK
jgi:hypothetical protein